VGEPESFVGTPAYMAPGGPGSPQSDIFSLGQVLYQMATGRPAQDFPIPPTVEVDDVIAKACHPDPRRRYRSAKDLHADLALLQTGQSLKHQRRLERWAARAKYLIPLATVPLIAGFLVLHSSQRARLEQLRAEQRTQEKEEAEIARQRRELLQQAQFVRLTSHRNGWSKEVWRQLASAANLSRGPDDRADIEELRNQAAASRSGIDAQESWREVGVGAVSVLFDATGGPLVAGAPGRRARLWEGSTASQLSFAEEPLGPVAFLAGTRPVQMCRARDGSLLVLSENQASGGEAFRGELKDSAVVGEAIVPGLVSLSADVSIAGAVWRDAGSAYQWRVWDVATGEERFSEELGGEPTCLGLSRDGRVLAIGDNAGRTTVWRLGAPAAEPKVLRARTSAILAVGFGQRSQTEDGAHQVDWLMAAGDAAGTVTIWDLDTGSLHQFCPGGVHQIQAVAFNSDSTLLAAGGSGHGRLWDVASGKELLQLVTDYGMTAVDFSPGSTRLARAASGPFGEKMVQTFALDSGRGLKTLRGLNSPVTTVAVATTGNRIAGLGQDWQIGVWEAQTGALLRIIRVPQGISADNAALVFSPDSRYLAFSSDTTAKLWDLETGNETRSWTLPRGVGDMMALPTAGELLLLRGA
jgi:hypothetical protein